MQKAYDTELKKLEELTNKLAECDSKLKENACIMLFNGGNNRRL